MMTRSSIISSGLITVNQWFEHSQNTALENVESLRRSALEAEDGSSLGVGMAEGSTGKPAAALRNGSGSGVHILPGSSIWTFV